MILWVGKEYAVRGIGPWTDLQLRLSGPLLSNLEDLFAEDWLFATRKRLSDPRYPGSGTVGDNLPGEYVAKLHHFHDNASREYRIKGELPVLLCAAEGQFAP